MSQLKHPNIVTYKESWEGGDGLLYIVMGFCEGGDLYRKLKEQKGQLLPESQVVEWFVQIAMALQVLSRPIASPLLQDDGDGKWILGKFFPRCLHEK